MEWLCVHVSSGQVLSKAPFRYEFQRIRAELSPICLFTRAAHNTRLSVYDAVFSIRTYPQYHEKGWKVTHR